MSRNNGSQTATDLYEATQHLLWPAFNEWVSENGVTFRTASHRLNTWRAFLSGYMPPGGTPGREEG